MKQNLIKIITIIFAAVILTACEDGPNTPTKEKKYFIGEELELVWKAERTIGINGEFNLSAEILTSVIGNKLIICRDTYIECYDKNTGKRIWQSTVTPGNNVKNMHFSKMDALILENAYLYLIDTGKIYKLDIGTGEIICNTVLNINMSVNNHKLSQSPENLYVCDRGYGTSSQATPKIYEISKSNCQVTNQSEGLIDQSDIERLEAKPLGPPTYYNGKIYVGTKIMLNAAVNERLYGGSIIAIDATSGKKIWETVMPPYDASCGIPDWKNNYNNIATEKIFPLDDGLIFATGISVTKVDYDGKILWRKVPKMPDGNYGWIMGTAFHQGYFYGYSQGSFAFKIDPNSGEQIWGTYVSPEDGYETTNSFNPITFDDKNIIRVTDDNWLFAMDLETGKPTWISWLSRQYTDEIDSNYDEPTYKRTGCWGAYCIEGDKVYYLGDKFIYCMKRKTNYNGNIYKN